MLVSIITIVNHYPEIFDSFRVPDGVDRQTVIDGICTDCAELELMYSDPEALQLMIRNWTDRHFKIWDELQKTLEYEYNPIWNVEGFEKMEITRKETEDRNLTDTHSRNGSEQQTVNETRNLDNLRTPDLTTTQSVAAYNSSSYEPREQVRETGTEDNKQTGTIATVTQSQEGGSEEVKHNGSVTGNGSETRLFTRGMNLGVTTTQQLIREQRELVQFAVSNYIIESFKETFCIMVY